MLAQIKAQTTALRGSNDPKRPEGTKEPEASKVDNPVDAIKARRKHLEKDDNDDESDNVFDPDND